LHLNSNLSFSSRVCRFASNSLSYLSFCIANKYSISRILSFNLSFSVYK
jgi:hypothetical protein